MVFALGFLVVLLVIAAGVHGLVLRQIQASGRDRQRLAAEALAQGAIARAVRWFDSADYRLPASSLVTAGVPVKLAANSAAVILPGNHPDAYKDLLGQARTGMVASYKKSLSQQALGAGTYSVESSLIAYQPETWEVVATATVGTTQRRVGALLVRSQASLFTAALFGAEYVSIGGNGVTDGYDASLGGYGGSNVFNTGDVGSNGDITLGPNAVIKGNAIAGPNGSATGGTVSGLRQQSAATRLLPAAAVPAGAVNLGAIKLSGGAKQTLTAGTYVATSLDISGGASLTADVSKGPIALYVTGAASIGGNGIVNTSGLPSNFSLVQVGGAAVTYSGNSTFAGTIYAPQSTLSLNGNGVLYGAFDGNAISMVGNATIHFDQSLRTVMSTPGPLRLTAQWTPP
ncbi:hypothetical protein KF840_02420 [bacterium]|nr:hypothetical protein [bacterium]